MKQALRALILFCAALASPSFGEVRKVADYGAIIGQDALARQILRAVVTKPNAGVQSFAALGSGQGIKLEAPRGTEPIAGLRDALNDKPQTRYDAAEGLKPDAGLLPKAPAAAKGSMLKASAQLKKLKKQGLAQDWGESSKRDDSLTRRNDTPSL